MRASGRNTAAWLLFMVAVLVLSAYVVARTAGAAPAGGLKTVKCEPLMMACVGTDADERFVGEFGRYGTVKAKGGDDLVHMTKEQGTHGTMWGDEGNDRLIGEYGWFEINGGPGNDYIKGGHLGDSVRGAEGQDTIVTGAGNDTVHSNDGEVDRVMCGSGNLDVVFADEKDVAADDCEDVY
jgi:Ca2+-binding RTX toxin-like protein